MTPAGAQPESGEKTVLLAGEGSNELGDLAKEANFRKPTGDPTFQHGVIEAFLRRVSESGWRIQDGLLWKSIPKYRAGNHLGAEARAVLGLCNKAAERGVALLVFCRDQDLDNREGIARRREIEEAIRQARTMFPDGPVVVGGVAVLRLESWVAAALGHRHTQQIGDGKIDAWLAARGIEQKNTSALREAVLAADLGKIPEDAESLRSWLAEVREALLARLLM
jgi:hypothetical protein